MKFGIEIVTHPSKKIKVITLKPGKKSRGKVLLSYRIEPFLSKAAESVSSAHTNYWESLQMARTFLDLGYCVDVIDVSNRTFIPKEKYSFFVSRTNFELAQLLNKDCIKIAHLDIAHWLFNNYASYGRSFALRQRKGVAVRSLRTTQINCALEAADYATTLGNQFTIDTYSHIKKTIFRVPLASCTIYPWPENKDFEVCRKNFLWFSGKGFVHKGLDLVLDAFVQMPENHLYICGPIQHETDFEKAYYKELYQSPNIHVIGWIDVSSSEFVEITKKCVGIIHLSCSEAGAGSVITCMHAGLIPIVSYESSVDVSNDFGVILRDCSIDTIKTTLQMISTLSPEKLKQMSRKAWEFVRTNHTREKFAEEYKKVITKIIEMHQDTN